MSGEELKLLPCKVCGDDGLLHHHKARQIPTFVVYCVNEDCDYRTCEFGGEEFAITAWNKRPAPAKEGVTREEVIEEFFGCAVVNALMEGPRLQGWNRSSLDRMWKKYRALSQSPSTDGTAVNTTKDREK